MSFPIGDYPTPAIVRSARITEIAQYTDTSQFEFFRDWINWVNNNDCNVRFDPPDDPNATTIRWYWGYYLPLGGWLWDGQTTLTELELRHHFAPLGRWPDDLESVFQPAPDPLLPNTVAATNNTTGAGE